MRAAAAGERNFGGPARVLPARAFSPMSTTRSSLAVVPAYNESATVTAVVESIRHHAPDFDVLVVDDGSTDDTAQHAEAAGATVVRLPFNLGIGGGVQAGLRYAGENPHDYPPPGDGGGPHKPAR